MKNRNIKYIISTVILSILSFSVMAKSMKIECWSEGNKIYQGNGYNIMYGDGFILFKEPLTHNQIYVNGDCVISSNNRSK